MFDNFSRLTGMFDSLLVEVKGLRFSRGEKQIFRGVELRIPRGRITAIMGPSGTGKTTLLKLMGGQLVPDAGEVLVEGQDIHGLSRKALFGLRRRMGMLFQSGALFSDLSVFENVAFPLRVHTDLPEAMVRDLVLMKLEAVGLRGARELMPSELSGGMARRVALARAIALDPDLVLYDEPFVGQDPISKGILVKLIKQLNEALGLTSVVVSHDIAETLSIADYVYVIADGQVMTGRIHALGRRGCDMLEALGRSAVFLVRASLGVPAREGWYLWLRQMHFVGVLSLAIILVSGLFIGMVLALQGYTILVDFGAEQALGQMVALSLLRELSPVVAALLFAGRAGSALTAEIGLMKATEQLSSMEMIGVDPLRRVVAPRLWAGFVALPLLTVVFSVVGVYGGYLVDVEWLGVFEGSYWGNMQASVSFLDDVGNGMIKSLVFALVVTWIAVFQGYDLVPTAEGISRATTRTVVYSSLSVLGLDFVLTAVMFGGFS